MDKIRLRIYQDEDGERPFLKWLQGLKDQSTRARVQVRLDRAEEGNLGDHKALGGGDKRNQRWDIEKARIYWADYLMRGGK